MCVLRHMPDDPFAALRRAEVSIPTDFLADNLFLLVRANPLRNLVAARLLTKPDNHDLAPALRRRRWGAAAQSLLTGVDCESAIVSYHTWRLRTVTL